MIRSVLDTDILSLLQHGNPVVARRVGGHDPGELATTIISVEEELSGWYTLLRRAKSVKDLVSVYERMTETVRFLRGLHVLSFTEAAGEVYERLRRLKPRVGRMDLRIAAIAISNQAMLVTRNQSDFDGIEGLSTEDWSRE
jgi:tRNA(fMet)-specific endonuclease VapC